MPVTTSPGTRWRILEAAFEEISTKGLEVASLDMIVQRAGVTKGALYHHFDSKKNLTVALIDEVLEPLIQERWLTPLDKTHDPLSLVEGNLVRFAEIQTEEVLSRGCPLLNLALEVSGQDEELRARSHELIVNWINSLRRSLQRGQSAGTVRTDLRSRLVATHIVASVEGLVGLARISRDPSLLAAGASAFCDYLHSLRPVN